MKLRTLPIIFIGLSLLSALANAADVSAPLQPVSFAQRNCSPSDDVYFTTGITEVSVVTCTWDAASNDSTISLTTHFSDPTITVSALCSFNGAGGDQISEVTGAKSGVVSAVSGLGTSTVAFRLNKVGTDANSNILFRLNGNMTQTGPSSYSIGNANYNGGTQISCKFTVNR